jgi:hypothetical protein
VKDRTTGHPSEDDLVLYHYRESGRAGEIGAHLGTCESCRSSYRALTGVLAAVESAPVPEPDEAFEERVWRRLEPRLAGTARPRWTTIFQPWRLALAGAVATLVVAAFLAGRHFPSSPASPASPAPPVTEAASHEPARDRILLIAVGDHLERSQMALVELVNAQAQDEMDISGEQRRARDLVSANRLYRQTAAREGEIAVASVLDDLERVLLEVAHSPSRLSSSEFDEMRQRIESQGIIFKVRVVESNVRERQRQPAREAARTRS